MYTVDYLKLFLALFITTEVNGFLPIKKRPYMGTNVIIPLSVQMPSSSAATQMQSTAPFTSEDLSVSLNSEAASSSGDRIQPKRKYHFNSKESRAKSLANLRIGSERQRQKARDKHESVTMALRGRSYDSLTAKEKEVVKKARAYYHDRGFLARKKGDYEDSNELRRLNQMLPTYSILRQPPTGPLSVEQKRRLHRAQMDAKRRERTQIEKFMKKEFGELERPT